jgi:drug/metabolite transporter (DMT)-like permease
MPILVTLAHAGPVPTAVYRCGLAVPVLAVIAWAERRRLGPRRPAIRLGAVLAGLFLAVDLVLFNHTITDAGAGVATIIGSLYVPMVAILAWLLQRERPGRRYLIMLPVVLLGIVLASGLVGARSGPDPAAGVATGAAASAAYAGFLLMLRRAGGQARHVAGQVLDATIGATAGSLLLGLAFGGLDLAVSWASLGWLMLLALGVQVAGWLLITSSLPQLPAAVSSLLLLIQPAVALWLGALVLHQPVSLIQVAGALLTCTGVLTVAGAAGDRGSASRERQELADVGTS